MHGAILLQFLEAKQSGLSPAVQGEVGRVGCRTGVRGSTILLCNLLSPEFLVFQVAVWLWELDGAHERVFSRGRQLHAYQPLLWVSFRQFFLLIHPEYQLLVCLNDLMREIQILRPIYHLCYIRGIGRRIPSPPSFCSFKEASLFGKGSNGMLRSLLNQGWQGFLPIQFPKSSMGKEECGWVFNLGKGNNKKNFVPIFLKLNICKN